MFPRLAFIMLSIVLSLSVAWAQEIPVGEAGKYRVELSTRPSPPSVGEALLIMKIFDGEKPLVGAGVNVHIDMTSMPMPADAKATPGTTPGEYGATVNFSMAGEWKIDVIVQQMDGMKMDGDGTATFLLETGKGITVQKGARVPWLIILVIVLVAAILAAVFFRKRIPPQARGIIAGILTLAVVLMGTVLVVRKYRDPTVSTVYQSAFMDMSAQAAPGTTAVATETVYAGAFQATVTYTGTVAPDSEEDIYPRVTGRLVAMPFYPGDRVKAGQVVAQLDTKELDAREAQAAFGRAGASQGNQAAEAETLAALAAQSRAQNAVDIARSQLSQAQSAERSAESGVKAAQSELLRTRQTALEVESAIRVAEAGIEQAEEMVAQVQADVASAEADVTYWEAEIVRSKKLYEAGAISREELDRSTAQVETARAKLNQAKATVRNALAGVKRAQQERAQAQARSAAATMDIATAEERVEQMRADRESAAGRVVEAQATVQTALADTRGAAAAVDAAAAKAGMALADVRRAQAALDEAGTVRGYTKITAANSGVVTARNIAPGVLVQPGMSILKIAKIDYVRLQTNVSEADIAAIRTGQLISARDISNPDIPISGRVTAVFPARDTTARTSIVEARILNPGGRLLPGQYISIDLHVGNASTQALSVPNQALQTRDGQTSLFIASNDGFSTVAKRVMVTTGMVSNARTEILTGLNEGDAVIIAGQDNLRDGAKVTAVKETTYRPSVTNVDTPLPAVTQPAANPILPGSNHDQHPAGVPSTGAGRGKERVSPTKIVPDKLYVCPMHPEVTSNTPAQCPKCGMDLVEKK